MLHASLKRFFFLNLPFIKEKEVFMKSTVNSWKHPVSFA